MSDPSGLTPNLDIAFGQQVSQDKMIEMNNGFTPSGKVSAAQTSGKGRINIPALGEDYLLATWNSIGSNHLDIRFSRPEDQTRIMDGWRSLMNQPDFVFTAGNSVPKGSFKPVTAYLEFHGVLVAGSVNLMLHSGTGKNAKINIEGGNLCFHTYDSKSRSKSIPKFIQEFREMAQKAFEDSERERQRR
jgi:hypothetical protein